ncbi:MAG: ornithine carbamoyltransferase [Candidatus Muiribacterium halophilum]|uniref:Ornithine carbamoyltransferase n=1 Tax=Muiribacterium halophilum TaxID=2053465 RepID=A0A2N5ZL79_MUIH1|nr:MAG: ornithine carbamoyltransferase [Candidatus Muirbacterium halophilum]
MSVNMKGKNFVSINDLSFEEFYQILRTTERLKDEDEMGIRHHILKGKTLAMIFQKPSTRTRVSFETGIYQLGGVALYLGPNDLQLKRGETISDTARVLVRYVDGIMARLFDHDDCVQLATHSTKTVINGLTDLLHPCQVMTDLFTIYEKKNTLKGLKVAFMGDGSNNMANSWIFGAAKAGVHLTIGTPEGYLPDKDIVAMAQYDFSHSGGSLKVTHDPIEAVKGVDVIYTDVWASMGQEDEREKRIKLMMPYQVNSDLVKHADENYLFMHCLPAHREEEVTAEVCDSDHSVIFDEAENRLHTQKAIMALMM